MAYCFHYSTIGERHVVEGQPCQDYAASYCDDDLAMAVVCDGHGGEPHFRSDVGARFAAEATIEAVRQFVNDGNLAVLAGAELQAFGTVEQTSDTEQTSVAYQTLRPLLASIVFRWMERISQHLDENPFTDDELQLVPEDYRPLYQDRIAAEAAYGTTLVAYVECRDCWLAFQIGDGISVVFLDGDECGLPIQPDEHCHDNMTTSLCDPTALNEFRFTVDGSGKRPTTAFVCTDGMQKCFKTDEELGDFLYKMSEVLRVGGKDALMTQMQAVLPLFSKITSGDDISIAGVSHRP